MEKTKEIIDDLKFSNKLRILCFAIYCGKNKEAYQVFRVKKVHLVKSQSGFNQD